MNSLRFIHRWLGLLLAAPLLVQGLSGAVLTLEPVLADWGQQEELAVPGGPGANALLAAAAAAAPPGMRVSRYVPSAGPASPARVQFLPAGQPRGPGVVLRLDPDTGQPLGAAAPVAGPMEWVKRLHTTLLVPQWGGRQIAGWFGVGLLALSVLGIPLWWPGSAQRAAGRWAEAFTVPRDARGVRLHRRLHGALGIWIWIMLAVTSVTGIVQGFPQTSRAVLGVAGGPARDAGGRAGRSEPVSAAAVDLDASIGLARAAAPGLRVRLVQLPAEGHDPIRVVLGPPGSEGVSSATTVLVDAAGPKVRAVQTPDQVSAGESALRLAHDLHFGQGFGPVWRGLAVLAGVALPVFSVTGVSLWALKRRNRRRLQDVKADAFQAMPRAGE